MLPRALARLDPAEDDVAQVALLEEQVAAENGVAEGAGIEGDRILVRGHELEGVVLHAPKVGHHRDADDRVR